MNFIKKYWFLIVILILATFLRFWKLDIYPALNADEAAIGYNAYSLIQTGMDEHGHSWPIHFQSFNDYKPGLYFYLVLPFVKLIGLNEWAVRIPGAFIGVLTVLAIYFLSLELFNNKKIATSAAFFLAISPWHIHFSRGGWEVNTATFLITMGLLMFLRAIKRPNFWTFSLYLLPFILSLYTYHAARVVTPLMAMGLLVIYRKKIFIKQNIKLLIASGSILVLLLIPLAHDLISSNALSRVAGVGLFADPGPINRINEQRGEHGDINSIGSKLIHNKVVNYGLAFLENWISHYHGLFLFVSGDVIQRNAVPETGEMYLFDIVFVLFGLVIIIKKFAEFPNSYSLLILWLLVAPVASALTFQSPNALRAQNMVIPLIILSSIGFVGLLDLIKTFNSNKLITITYLLGIAIVGWQFARYEHMYSVHMAKEYPFSSQYGVKELVEYLDNNNSKYQKVYVTDKYDQPYILFLFYKKYPPQLFQKEGILTPRDNFGFSTVRDFSNYHFEILDFKKVLEQHSNVLIAASPDEVPKGVNIIKKIYGSNGYEYFDIISN